MKNLNLFLLLLVIFLLGLATSYYGTRNIWSKSQARSVLEKHGDVITNEEALTYIKGVYLWMSSIEVEALAVLSQDYETIAVMADESIIPKDSLMRAIYYSTDDNGKPLIK